MTSKQAMKKGKFKDAYEMLSLPISHGIRHADIFYLIGESARIIKKYHESEQYFLQALKFQIYSPYVLFSLGLLYLEQNEYNTSEKMFENFLKIRKPTSEAYFYLSQANYGNSKNLEALVNISKAIEINDKEEYRSFRSELYSLIGYRQMAHDEKK